MYIAKNMSEGDAIHFPANLICANFDSIPKGVKIFLTIHDITPLLFYKNKRKNGNYFSNGESVSTKQFENNLLLFLPRIDCIITVSENTKCDIVSRFGINESKIVPIYNGIDSRFVCYSKEKIKEIRTSYNIPNGKIIMAINGGKHKNIIRVILAFFLYCIKNRNEDMKFILVGRVSKKIRLLTNFMKKKFILAGRVPDEILIDYYNIADGFIFASLYEGFGFPLLEALACGSYVVCSKTSSLGELGKGYAYLVNPLSVLDIANSFNMIKRKTDEEINEQRQYVQNFTWDNTADRHMEIINIVMSL